MNYYTEVESLIQKYEVNKRARKYQEDNEKVLTYWNVGRLIVEAQGSTRAKYGKEIIKEWSKKLTEEYGKGYTATNLKYFRIFYLTFPKCHPLGDKLNWSQIRAILPIKDENKRNYYINLCITHSLSKRELENAIKNNSYERILDKPDKIEIIGSETNREYHLTEHIKNPIVITLSKKDIILKEKDLQLKILAELKNFFMELGEGYAFIGNEYKIKYGGKTHRIDILLFNVELNAYVVVELKTRELKATDKGQIELYMKIVDNTLKRNFHNKTIGIIVSKYQDKFIVSFVSSPNLISLTYELHETT